MSSEIPFVTGVGGARLSRKIYDDAAFVRIPLEIAGKLQPLLASGTKVWVDPCVDGMDDLEPRRHRPNKENTWLTFMGQCDHFDTVANPSFHAKPMPREVEAFVFAVLDRCASFKPSLITVPQLPIVGDASRNKINRALATAAGAWKSKRAFAGGLILPVVLTHQDQANKKTARNPKVELASRCYADARAEGFWIVDSTLTDDSGSQTLASTRFPGLIAFHEEINEAIPSKMRVAGPYWGLNLVLWARGLVDHPAIGVGSGYQYFLAGMTRSQPSVRVALPPLRRRAGVGRLKPWLEAAMSKVGPANPAHAEFAEILGHLALLQVDDAAREQVASFYKRWCDVVGSVPKEGRSMALFQDLSAAYALGKPLPSLHEDGTTRRPESVAEPLMMSCL